MNVRSVVAATLVAGWLFAVVLAAADPITVKIDAPTSNMIVNQRAQVDGRVSDPSAAVWVVVHEVNSTEYWVQSPINVASDGTWTTLVAYGKAGVEMIGKRFELRAFANPEGITGQGKRTAWPAKAAARSPLVVVVRSR